MRCRTTRDVPSQRIGLKAWPTGPMADGQSYNEQDQWGNTLGLYFAYSLMISLQCSYNNVVGRR